MSVSSSALVVTFLEDSDEILGQMEELIIELERYPGNIELLNKLFRIIHTLKGTSSFMGFVGISGFAHELENLLHMVRNDEIEFSPETLDLVFRSFEIFKIQIDDIRKDGMEKERDLKAILEDFRNLAGRKPEDRKHGGEPAVEEAGGGTSTNGPRMTASRLGVKDVSAVHLLSMLPAATLEAIMGGGRSIYHLKLGFQMESSMQVARAMLVLRELDMKTRLLLSVPPVEYLEEEFEGSVDFLLDSDLPGDAIRQIVPADKAVEFTLKRIDVEDIRRVAGGAVKHETLVDDRAAVTNASAPGGGTPETPSTDRVDDEKSGSGAMNLREDEGKNEPDPVAGNPKMSTEIIRVDIRKLDNLMNLVGELVTNRTRNHDLAMRLRSEFEESECVDNLFESIQEQARIIYEIQEGIMNSRLVPVGTIFKSVPLVVREISRNTGKSVECRISGESTELDKKLVDGIREAIMHLVRNAVDHGIESPSKRKAIGKGETGILKISAYREYSQIVINIEDDGRGIDREKVRQKAVEKGLIDPGEAAGLTEAGLISLILQPGFSTSEQVTGISGRGVGLDVVKKEIENLKGSIEIVSEFNKGTTVTMRVPITLAIIQGLLVKSGDKVFAIPISSVSEIVRLDMAEVHGRGSGDMLVRMRDSFIELYTLEDLLGLKVTRMSEGLHVVVVNSFGKAVGIIVDGLLGEREIVIKSMESGFVDVDGVAGASIMGDGTVILIIDIPVLLRKKLLSSRPAGPGMRSLEVVQR